MPGYYIQLAWRHLNCKVDRRFYQIKSKKIALAADPPDRGRHTGGKIRKYSRRLQYYHHHVITPLWVNAAAELLALESGAQKLRYNLFQRQNFCTKVGTSFILKIIGELYPYEYVVRNT